MRFVLVSALLCACSSSSEKKVRHDAPPPRAPDARLADAEPAGLAPHHTAPDLAAAIRELVTDDVRAVGVGELHQRVDRETPARSALARFGDEVLPVLASRASDLVVETWIPDKKCGAKATQATARVEASTQRPAGTRSELSTMVEQARTAGIQPHAMRLGCDDWTAIAPAGPKAELDIAAMLTIITRELGRIAVGAITLRDKQQSPRRLVVTYGGALHNDLYPTPGVEDWSFAAKVDAAAKGKYLELDLIVPEYAELDDASKTEPWYPLLPLTRTDRVVIVEVAARSYAVLLARTKP